MGLENSLLGRALLPAIGSTTGEEAGFIPRLLIAIELGIIIILNVAVIRLLPFRMQILVVWLELLAGFLLFFYSFDLTYQYIWDRLGLLLIGTAVTIYVSAAAIIVSSILALVAALARLSKSGPAFAIATYYISFFRGTPLLVQVFLIYTGLPQVGLVLDAVPAGILALSLCYGAYMAEIFRAGIQGVPSGQSEAAAALGLRKATIFRKIVFPQAMRLVVPPTGNQFIAMLKDSSLVSFMGVMELFNVARIQARTEFKFFEMLITAAVFYWVVSIVFETIQARIEAHYGKGVRA
ncbi:MAG: amino acid ABC transporter permease [Rhodospirillaceae bacterium]|nr:amino acid ABC transporter permease [Rhodospirillaceae bacterium]MBT6118500.1 amino acid ABC transporter permease [Rhodospirillaceae bacterium]